jgi:hypothetical protein
LSVTFKRFLAGAACTKRPKAPHHHLSFQSPSSSPFSISISTPMLKCMHWTSVLPRHPLADRLDTYMHTYC